MSSNWLDIIWHMPVLPSSLTIGELAARSGLAPSALRFYESRGLIAAERSESGWRRYHRSVLRRLALISVAQQVGLSLEQVRLSLQDIPLESSPTRADWELLSDRWRLQLDDRIAQLERLRDDLTGCIGCGCLSLRRCRLYNRADASADEGAGSRLQRAYGRPGHLIG